MDQQSRERAYHKALQYWYNKAKKLESELKELEKRTGQTRTATEN